MESRCSTCGLPDGLDYGDLHECPPGFTLVSPSKEKAGAGSPPKVTSPCGCGHARLMHGDLVWDTACRECNCARYYERWCCDTCAAEGWQCPAFCGRPCCETAVVERVFEATPVSTRKVRAHLREGEGRG